MSDAKRKQKNLYMAGVDLKKAFDSVPLDWIHHCLHWFGVHPMFIDFLDLAMTHWQTTLTVKWCGWGMFQLSKVFFKEIRSLSPLLYL